MVTRTTAIKNFLTAHTHPDLASLYNYNMEVQVNVAHMNGNKVDGDYKGIAYTGWTDGINTWKPFRIPWNASSTPTFEDSEIKYDLVKYAEGVGLTGWDWKNQLSRWCAYDFDAISGHSSGHTKKLTTVELQDLRENVSKIPWVNVRSSTSGSGLHLYVFLQDPVHTKTHTEHAALARSILGMMSAMSGQDLQAKIDACGQNMWVWHRKMLGTTGLTLLKSGISLDKIPPNWKDHLDVVSGKRRRTIPMFVKEAMGSDDDYERIFEELTGQRSQIPLDQDHMKLLKYIEGLDFSSWWDNDSHMLVTHTYALKQAHKALSLKGVYDTLSNGTDPTHNCFCYPLRLGAWVIRRYTRGVAESKSWDQDRNGMTRCYYNRGPDLLTLAKSYGAVEHSKGGYVFSEAEVAATALQQLGIHLDIPANAATRSLTVVEKKDGKLILEMQQDTSHDAPEKFAGWLPAKNKWTRVVRPKEPPPSEHEVTNHDDVIRHLVDTSRTDCGWVMKSCGSWKVEPIGHVSLGLKALGLEREEISVVEGASVLNPWTLVNQPFQPEYVGDRCWNRDAVQIRFPPTVEKDNLRYPTWTTILRHCGAGLDKYMDDNDWTKSNGITTGGDYLKCWIASIFQMPTEPLPYLFFYSKKQNNGKSTFHEALSLLMTKGGVVDADRPLSDTTFNGELANAVLCYIEETDLRKNKGAYAKIKAWTTSRYLTIRKLYEQPYSVVNTCHFCQFSNDVNAVPIELGDTRICMINVPELAADKLVAKRDLMIQLEKEAPDFLASILSLEIPDYNDRMRIPVIQTSDKVSAEHESLNQLELFIEEKCFYRPGVMVLYSEFYNKFRDWLDVQYVDEWSQIKVGKLLDKDRFPKGRDSSSQFHIGNISFKKPSDEDLKSKKLVLGGSSKDKLIIEKDVV